MNADDLQKLAQRQISGDRNSLQEKLNNLNQKYQDKFVEMKKANATPDQMQKLREIRQAMEDKFRQEGGDGLSKLNAGGSIPVKGGTVLGEIPQKGLPDMSEVVNLGKEQMWKKNLRDLGSAVSKGAGKATDVAGELAEKLAKKGLKSLPVVGGLAAAIANKDAMAAASSIPVVGEAFNADNVGKGSDQITDEPAFPTYENPKDMIMAKKPEQQLKQSPVQDQAALGDFAKILSGEQKISPEPNYNEDNEEELNNLSRFSRLQKQIGR